MKAALRCESIRHTYGTDDLAVEVLKGVDIDVQPAECAVLTGPSGSGKTTLLSIAGCLLTADHGDLIIAGERVVSPTPATRAKLRRERIGFVFQHAQLLPFLSVRENLEVVGRNAGLSLAECSARISNLLISLEMESHRDKKASVLSGGQKQRVAVARALLHRPAVVLADEPTASLGWEIGQVVVDLLTQHAREEGSGLLVVTHDTRLLGKFDQRFEMEGGIVRKVYEI